jgi:hypothetical protein
MKMMLKMHEFSCLPLISFGGDRSPSLKTAQIPAAIPLKNFDFLS